MCIGLNMPVKCPKPEIKVIHNKIGDTIFPLTCRITVSYVSEIALYSFVVTSFEIYSEEACRGQRRHGREESGLGQLYYISSFKRCTWDIGEELEKILERMQSVHVFIASSSKRTSFRLFNKHYKQSLLFCIFTSTMIVVKLLFRRVCWVEK